MKRTVLIIIFLCFAFAAFSQSKDKNVNVRIESVRVGDSVYYKKITTTTDKDKVRVKEEILSSSKINSEHPFLKKDVDSSSLKKEHKASSNKKSISASITGINLIFSTLNNNSNLNSLLGMKGINNINVGGDISLGLRFHFGIELKGSFAMERLMNKADNKKLRSVSTIGALSFAYPFRIKADKYMILPYSGLGFNSTKFEYSQTTNRSISFEELKANSWEVYSNNLFIPLGVEFLYRLLPVSYLSFGVEYRFNVYNSGAMLPNTRQKVYDFPKFTINNLGIKIGLTGIFNK